MPPQNRKKTGARAGTFKAGQSGNPGGRPKGASLSARIRDETRDGDEILEYVLDIARNEDLKPEVRLQALTWLSDRGFGKPTQTLELGGGDGEPITVKLAFDPDA
jgi:hypothetical protein